MIVPGYGMAVAQAQHVVKDITESLRAKEVNVGCDSPSGRETSGAYECLAS